MVSASQESFLQGGGELGSLIRGKDWEKTQLGNPAHWPQSLKTAVRIVLTSRQPMFVWWGPELINIYNDAYKSIVGGKHPKCLGQPAAEVWKEIWNEIGPRAKKVMQENVGTYDEALLLLMERNGYTEETYYTFSYSPVPGEDGNTQGIICANTDDTQRILGERRLRTLRELARNVIGLKSNTEVYEKSLLAMKGNPQDFPFVVLYQISADGLQLKIAGKTPAELPINIAPAEVDLDASAKKYPEVLQAILTGKVQKVSNISARFGTMPSPFWEKSPDEVLLIPILQNNHDFPFALMAVGLNPYRLLDDEYVDFFNLVADQIATALTNVYALKSERKRAEALAEIDKAKTIFFSNISHEFRTPLTLMLGPLEDMINNVDSHHSEEDQRNLEISHRNAVRLLRLVNSLLDFSRIEAGRVDVKYRAICLGDYTSNLASSFRSLIERAGLGFEITTDVKSAVYVDTEMWEKIILNLLSNAYKYTLSGKISISVIEQGNVVVTKISDTGSGIPARELPLLFERFHRVKNTAGRSFEGSGIGLSLVRELVRLNHGTISAESVEGTGSIFTVTMPIGKEHLAPEDIMEIDLPPLEILPASHPEELLQPLKPGEGPYKEEALGEKATVLVVDDNADMQQYICKLLERQYRVITADNGRQALDKIASQTVHLVLSDIMMPVMDGIELLQALKADFVLRRIPVVLLSARAGEEAKIEGYDLGADDYLVKPFSAKELLARVKSQLRIAQTKNHLDQQLRNVFMQAPIAICLLRGEQFIVEIANARILKIWGKEANSMINRPVFEGIPEAARQGYLELLQGVYSSGKPYIADEMALDVERDGILERSYIKFVYEPFRDEDGTISGVMVIADDITDSVASRMRVEASEIRHKLAMEAAEMGSFEWILSESRFIHSKRLAEIFGLGDSGIFKQSSFIELIHPDDAGIRTTAHRKALVTGILFYEARVIWPDGSIHWVRLNGKMVYAQNGKPDKMYGTVLDITDQKHEAELLERKVAERTRKMEIKNRELIESEERYQRMTEEVEDYAILLLDTSGKILNWNKGAQKIKGYSDKEIIGQHITIFYLPEDQQTRLPEKLINEATINGRAVHEGYRIRKDGTKFWGSITITALHDENNRVIGFSKVTRDLTERKLAEDKIKKYNSELEFQNRELEQFAFIASHDLQEPLRKIQMFSGMLERNLHNPAEVEKYFGKINSSAERMSELIRSVLNYSRLSRTDDQFKDTDPNIILENVLTDYELMIEEKQAVVKSDDIPHLMAIPLQINQLFSNLVGNALKFAEEKPVISISSEIVAYAAIPFETNLRPDSQYLQLIFSDNGIGFEQKYASQIFTIFQRLNQRTAYNGTGIGLALCKKIVENHQGFITALSEPGKGASFYIYFPLTRRLESN